MILLCRELSKNNNVICLTRPLYNDVNSLCQEDFLVYQTSGFTDIYDPLRSFLRFFRRFWGRNNSAVIDQPNSGVINQLAGHDKEKPYIKLLVKTFLSLHRIFDCFFAFPDTEWPWFFSAMPLAHELVHKHKPDIVITNYPFTSHLIGANLKNKYPNIKWIVDFVDLWSLNHFYPYPQFRYFWESKFEKRTLRKADKVITCLRSLASLQADLLGRDVSTIYHSAPLDDYQSISHNHSKIQYKSNYFTIRYFGTFYSKFQRKNFEVFRDSIIKATEYLKSNNIEYKSIRIQFIGTKCGYLSALDLPKRNEITYEFLPRVPRYKALELMCSSDCLLLPFYESKEGTVDVLGSTFIDYVCSDNVTLLVGNTPDEFKLIAGDKYPICNSIDSCTKELIGLLTAYSENKDQFLLSNYIDKTIFDLSLLENRFLEGI